MKITPDHLARGAFVYVRQSTVDQLANNHESRRRQYGLAERARTLGWIDVTVIDDDLGRSGSGVSRPGFERFRRVGEIAMLDTAMRGEFERPGMRLICPIDSHECSKLDFIFLPRVYHWNAPLICETQAGSASAKIV